MSYEVENVTTNENPQEFNGYQHQNNLHDYDGYAHYGVADQGHYYSEQPYNQYQAMQYGSGMEYMSPSPHQMHAQFYDPGYEVSQAPQHFQSYQQYYPQYNDSQQQWYNSNRSRGGYRGRGRGNRQPDNYYQNDGKFENSQHSYSSFDGTKPKQFSYQGNRYRDNRRRTPSSNQSDGGAGASSYESQADQNTTGRKSGMKSYSSSKRHTELKHHSGEENDGSVEVENYFTEAIDLREEDELTYGEKTRRNGSANSGASARGGGSRGGSSRVKRGRGGYKRDIEYSVEVSRKQSEMTSLRSKKDHGDKSQMEKSFKPNDKSDSKKSNYRGKKFTFKGDQDDETQRGLLIEQLSTNSYECMVCCEAVRRDAAVWGCNNCFHIYHLRCIKKWARSSTAAVDGQSGWRCPACQNLNPQVPNQYRCFCGKVRDPENNRYETPHSCGEVCGKKRLGGCPHACIILCHPGPCPTCQATVSKSCNCGRFKMTVKCGQAPAIQCQEVCGKTLNCGLHQCSQICHSGSCKPCEQVIKQSCYCDKDRREVTCGSSDSFKSSYSCGSPCQRKLSCENHTCSVICHAGPCEDCSLSPDQLTHCPCGRTSVTDLLPPDQQRQSCTDPIPTCQQPCDKTLQCGPTGSPHHCVSLCHIGPCPSCPDSTQVHCRCGALTKKVPCDQIHQYTDGSSQYLCDKRCNKKKDCGRHRCSQQCCVEVEHKCDQICGHKLSCGLHRCEEICHRGNCRRCWNVSFDELKCHCGSEVLYPPVECGAKPPECRQTCTRVHKCGHKVLHNCHSEPNCPPCTALTEKWCLGKHELRRNIPCHLTEITCGMKCNKPLPCGQHKCQKTCHKGECVQGKKCDQACTVLRPHCGHMCGERCHVGSDCPDTPCTAEVQVKCTCGRRSEKAICQTTLDQQYHRVGTTLALCMNGVRDGHSVDISTITATPDQKKPYRLECNQECAIKERNKRVALALEIKNPDLSSKLGSPSYTDFLKDYTKKNASFVSGIEKTLSTLVQTAQTSAQKYRSHAFSPMSRDQRRVVHELAEHYGCQTQSYDEEPKKNVVVSAYKDKCYKPSVSLTAFVQRELHPKAPVPIPHRSSEDQIRCTVQAAKQSTALPKTTALGAQSTAWFSKTSKPLNSWTTLQSSKAGNSSSQNTSSDAKKTLSSSSQKLSAGGDSIPASASNPWTTAKSNSVKKSTEPLIDYFEMTD